MRVGINFEDFPLHWQGGVNYYNNLIAAFALHNAEPIVGFCGHDKHDSLKKAIPGAQWVCSPLLTQGHPLNILRRTLRKATGTDWLLDRYLQQQNIDVLTHSAPLGTLARTPCISWIPDFQHVHLPHLFTPAELAIRNDAFKKTCLRADAVFVSSQAAANDLIAFEPRAAQKCKVLRFCINPIQADQLLPADELKRKYELPGDYFYIPNQFWPHKNHLGLLRAIAELKSMGDSLPTFVFSGAMDKSGGDPYVDTLLEFVQARNLQVHVRFLGSIPYKDVLSLVNASLAVINPSLFEGWSTSVEESKELNKYMLLSNLDVNLEQIQEGVSFFSPDDPKSIAGAIQNHLQKKMPSDAKFIRNNKINMNEFGHTLTAHLKDIRKQKPR